MLTKTIFHDEKGMVTVLMALLLPVMLGMVALVIDSANLYTRQAELQFLARQSATSGLLELGNVLEQKAQAQKIIQCTVVPPTPIPAVCHSTNLFDFLTANEILLTIEDLTVQQNIENNSQNFAKNYDPKQKTKIPEVQTILGESFVYGQDKVELKVIIQQETELFFHNILSTDPTLTITGISHLSLQ